MTPPLNTVTGSTRAGDLLAVSGTEEFLRAVTLYLSSAWPMWTLFAIGIGLGYLWARRKTRPEPETSQPETNSQAPPEPESESISPDPAVIEGENRRAIAELEGELNAARRHSEQLREELATFSERLKSAHHQRDEVQARFAELSESLRDSAAKPDSRRSLAHARAPVIHLNEMIQQEQQHLEAGIARLQELEARLNSDSQEVWRHVEEVERLRKLLDEPESPEGESTAAFVKQIGVADEHLRVFHQNVQSCVQRIEGAKARLRSDEKKLEQAESPVAKAESALAKLAASEEPPGRDTITTAFETAGELLKRARRHLAALENGVEQEIAELTGRIDWVIKDSPRNFLNAHDAFSRLDPPASPDLRTTCDSICRHLNEARATLTGIELPVDGDAFGESRPGKGGVQPIRTAAENASEVMESAVSLLEAMDDSPEERVLEAEGVIAHLKRQLVLRESETERLERKLKANVRELQMLRGENERLASEAEPVGISAVENDGQGNFVRRLLGLQSEESATELTATATGLRSCTLAEAREILGELKRVSTSGEPMAGSDSGEDTSEEESEDSAELDELRARVALQQDQIRELKETLAALPEPPVPENLEETTPEVNDAAIEPVEESVILVPATGLILFRGNHPEIWGTNTYFGANSRSRDFADLPADISWLRLRRLPGGESVIVPITRDDLTDSGEGKSQGFNGSNEHFYGAHHLGIFDESLPQEVETRFTYGGWGFGHRPAGEESQACGWNGLEIDPDTVFEITVYRDFPDLDEYLDRVIEG